MDLCNFQKIGLKDLDTFRASNHARLWPEPASAFLGGVWGKVRLKTARVSEAIPATIKVHLVAS